MTTRKVKLGFNFESSEDLKSLNANIDQLVKSIQDSKHVSSKINENHRGQNYLEGYIQLRNIKIDNRSDNHSTELRYKLGYYESEKDLKLWKEKGGNKNYFRLMFYHSCAAKNYTDNTRKRILEFFQEGCLQFEPDYAYVDRGGDYEDFESYMRERPYPGYNERDKFWLMCLNKNYKKYIVNSKNQGKNNLKEYQYDNFVILERKKRPFYDKK